VFTKDGLHTLANIINVNLTCVDLFPQSCTTQGFVTSNIAQVEEKSYYDQHPTYQFLPLAIKVFGASPIKKLMCFFYTIVPMKVGASKG
jgi:hypothetical protein